MTKNSDLRVILSKLDDIKKIQEEMGKDIKDLTNNTIRQDERIKNLEIQFVNEGRVCKLEDKIEKTKSSLDSFKIQILGLGTLAATLVSGIIEGMKIIFGVLQ